MDFPNIIESLFRTVHDLEKFQILSMDHTIGKESFPKPFDKRSPEFFADCDKRDSAYFSGLDQGQDFRELIQSAESAGIDNASDRIFQEADFPYEEIAEIKACGLIFVRGMFRITIFPVMTPINSPIRQITMP